MKTEDTAMALDDVNDTDADAAAGVYTSRPTHILHPCLVLIIHKVNHNLVV